MRKCRTDYEETGLSDKDKKYPEFPVDLGGPYIIMYTREGRFRKQTFNDFDDKDVKQLVEQIMEAGISFEIVGVWKGAKRSDFFVLNSKWCAKKLGLTVVKQQS